MLDNTVSASDYIWNSLRLRSWWSDSMPAADTKDDWRVREFLEAVPDWVTAELQPGMSESGLVNETAPQSTHVAPACRPFQDPTESEGDMSGGDWARAMALRSVYSTASPEIAEDAPRSAATLADVKWSRFGDIFAPTDQQ
jgi:hypothetical protein